MKRGPAACVLSFALAVAASARAQTKPPPAPPAVEEVEVKGRKTPKANQTTLSGQEVRQIPGAFGDHFRAVETLPGVTPLASGVPFFFIRGAPPGNNGYYLDGIRIPVLYHVALGPSVVHPGLVRRVDFYPGGYPARYGRFAGGILSGEIRQQAGELHGEGNIRLFDAGALVETPFANNRGTFLFGGRYSYPGAVLSLVAPEARLSYWDYQTRVTWDLGDDDTIGAFAFGSYDFLGDHDEDTDVTKTIFATQFHRVDLRWDHRLPKRGKMRVAATIGIDETGTDQLQGVRDRLFGVRMLLEQPVEKDVLVRGGLDTMFDHYDLADREFAQRSSSLYPPRNDLVVGAFVDTVLKPHPRWEVTPGIRTDLFGSVLADTPTPIASTSGRRMATAAMTNGAKVTADPRLLSRLSLTDKVTLVSTFGVVHQPPAFFVPIPGLQLGRLGQGLQKGAQTSQGVEVSLPLGFSLTTTLFYNQTIGLTDFIATCSEDGDIEDPTEDDDCIDRRVRGRTIGMELLVRRSLTQRLTGWLAYTLSRTTRTIRRTGISDTIPGDFDRTHVLNLIGAYDLGRNWRAGARFYLYSGRPWSPTYNGVQVPPYNSRRMSPYWRADVRLEKAWKLGEKGRISVVIEVLNTTLNKEVFSIRCTARDDFARPLSPQEILRSGVPPELLDVCTEEEFGPITIPSFGVEGSF